MGVTKKKNYTHKHLIQVPIYRVKFEMVLTNDFKYVREYLEDDAFVYATTYDRMIDGVKHIIIALNLGHTSNITHGVIAHEAVHAAIYTLDCIGEPINANNQESCAYLQEWFVDQVYLFLESKKLIHKISIRR